MKPTRGYKKEELYDQVLSQLQSRKEVVLESIRRVEEGLNSESKSSAGDKHETGRAMLQLEREKLGRQLKLIETDEKTVSRISINESSSVIKLGSLVSTSQLNYFLSVAIGAISMNNETIYAISMSSPIGQELVSKKVGDLIQFRDQQIKVLNVE